ncbi:calcium-activated chloride channel-domain-containing protein [Pelagophyceae sp. CCMP2097]|nr:calcium-activated chloride channel-domain-containing protein [Pelagophyceae sp. CCMP2097]
MQNQLRCGDFKALFPLHDAAMARRLLADWNMIDPPLGAVKDYFGERVGMYFAFLCHFAKWCSLSALVGVACTILGFFEKALLHRPRRKSRSLPLFSIFQCLWAIVMLETWKRQEARLCLDWGMHGAGAAWSARPEFVGERRSSLVHGRSELFFSQSARRGRLRLSSCAILVLVFVLGAGALGAILARVYFERWLPKTVFIFGFSAEAKTVASVAGSVFTTLQIEIANYLYSIIAWHLNEYENHRTSQDYMNAMIFKVVPFYLLNYNCPLFYDAFLRRSFEGCTGGAVGGSATRGAGTCYSQLELSLGIIFLTKMVANAVADRLKPWYGTVMRRRAWLRRKADAARRGVKRAAWMKRAVSKRSVGGPAKSDDDDCPAKADYGDFESQKTAPARGTREAKLPDCAEDDFLLEEADDVADTLEDYTTLAIRFSFVTLFVTALPVLPVLAWFANHTEGYLDLTKLLTLKRRLWPRDAGGIGSWLRVFQMITILSVTSNAACIFYVFNWTPLQDDRPLGPAEKAWGFFAFQYAVLFIMFLAELATPDVPDDVAIQLERQKFISSKLIENVPDESTDPDLSDFDDGPSPRSADPPRAEAAFFGAAGVAELAVRSRKKAAPRRSDKAPSYTNARDRGKLKRAFKKVEKGGYASGADLQEVLRKHTSRPASDVAATLPSFGFGDKDRLDLRELEDVHAALQGAAALEESAVAARDIDFEFDGLATALLDC